MVIGNKLRRLRIEKGYSQEYLADVLAISQKTYSNMENDKSSISIDTLKKIAEEYKIDLIELISEDKVIVQINSSTENNSFRKERMNSPKRAICNGNAIHQNIFTTIKLYKLRTKIRTVIHHLSLFHWFIIRGQIV